VGVAVLVGWLVIVPTTSAAAPPRFLSLPFLVTSGMQVERGWWANGLLHHAIDYIRGAQNAPATWQPFVVLAAASGAACAQLAGRHGCIDIPGERVTNRVAIRHRIAGHTYVTVYEDLRSIAPGVPVGGRLVAVARGQALGISGNGEGNPPNLIHLHFEVLDADGHPVDPYDIYGPTSAAYPNPEGTNGLRCGPRRLWFTDPPAVSPSGAQGPRARASIAPASASPEAGAPEASAAWSAAGSTVPAWAAPGSTAASMAAHASGRAATAPATMPVPGAVASAATAVLAAIVALVLAHVLVGRRHAHHEDTAAH
jgi:hypothetical protein